MIYIVCFLISCSFFWLSEKCKGKFAKNGIAIIAILIPCLLAGLRADTIGTDVKVYVEPMYNAAKESHTLSAYMNQRWFVIWRYMYVNKFEIGFSLMVFLIQKLGGSFAMVLFFIQLLIIAPIYVGLKKIHKPYPICFGMFVFYCLFYIDLDKDTYVAFVRYDMKIKDIYTEVPGLGTLYVTKDSQGNYQITQQVKNEEIRAYINRIAGHEDVQTLMDQTHEDYQNAVNSDALLREALDDLKRAYEDSTGN